jgi:hypothetical protein
MSLTTIKTPLRTGFPGIDLKKILWVPELLSHAEYSIQ